MTLVQLQLRLPHLLGMRRQALALVAAGACLAQYAAYASAPNVVLILADDLESDYKQDRLAIMPNLRTRIREQGAWMRNHVAAHPVCGPSRTSILAGRYPHNVGYKVNDEPASIAAWAKQENNTVGTWLTAAGYHTAFHGKYVNSMETHVPSGWSHWGGFASGAGTYNFYNATAYNVTFGPKGHPGPIDKVTMTGVHQTEFLGEFAMVQMRAAQAQGKPFFIMLNPVTVHWGTCYGPCDSSEDPRQCYQVNDPHWEWAIQCPPGETDCCPDQPGSQTKGCALPIDPCPTVATAHMFDGQTNPHTPSWNQSATGDVPEWIAAHHPGMSAFEAARQDMGFRNRSSSAVDLDNLIKTVLDNLEALGVADNTFVIFTSDNGYHLGEHRLVFGKGQPYDTDIRLPFYMIGPGIPPNVTLDHPTTHVDMTATIVDLAGATPVGPPLDGLSFRGALSATPIPPQQWRNFSFSEYFGLQDTWFGVRRPLDGDQYKFHWWCTGTPEVFDIAADPWELANLAGQTPRGSALANQSLPIATALHACAGANCSAPIAMNPVPPMPLECYNTSGLPAWSWDP